MFVVLEILILLLVAKGAGELVERAGYPSLIGEITAGLILGPSLLGLIELGEVLKVFADLGLIVLLFLSGIETDLKNLASAEKAGTVTAICGVVIPFVLGFGLGYLTGMDTIPSVFLGIALAITSIGISVRALVDEHALSTPIGSIIITSAVIDDLIGILLLAALSAFALGGGLTSVAGTAILALIFITFMVTGGRRILGGLYAKVRRHASHESAYSAGLIMAFASAAASQIMGLHLAIGAFFAGLALSDRIRPDRTIEGSLSDLGLGFLVPFFFASIGLSLTLSVDTFQNPLLIPLVLVAFSGKIIGGYIGSRHFLPDNRSALLVGLGLSPRGEVALVVATMALSTGIITNDLFTMVTLMVIATALVAPLFLRIGFKALRRSGDAV
ncbi:MAG: Sodium/hydrogen exchanger [Methanocalculus sp. 52_23]|jgi:Kef-type K+ transport system membrane component KefB|uniref:cation:proton antiporter n=1 Tax=Methanocalculus sp. TaxID=2004547 RepID=UPI000746587C|nr:cation:proton antiporter [Methanocalculus sp.]KUK71032.1 MAG: Sodium/hydrogen exchanger [Methanocalculus sp. 52_23]HIJ06628.1 cation:proton antiporter [Methanocalculus sp.]